MRVNHAQEIRSPVIRPSNRFVDASPGSIRRWQMIPKGLPSILSIDNLALFACNFRDANAQPLGDVASVGGDATSTLDFHSGLAFREDVSYQ
jgi:hypothetical protein